MKRSGSPNIIWWLALIVAISGILIHQGVISIKNVSSFWLEVVAAGLFALATLIKK